MPITQRKKGRIFQDLNAFDLLANEIATDLPAIGIANLPTEYKEIAGFGNVTWHVTDRFDITGGGRFSKNKQELDQELGGALFDPTPITESSSEDVFTYSVAPRFEINDQTAIYARIAKGYRPGGPNICPAGAPAGDAYDLRCGFASSAMRPGSRPISAAGYISTSPLMC